MNLKFEKLFFCTGARNHDLLKIFETVSIDFELDERVASFKALGLSKISERPVAICTTSGTAVAECVPAMLEAFYSENPLILISGDRPKKLHGTGSPQTVDHELITRCCRRSYVEVELSELKSIELDGLEFPVHINVLVDDTTSHEMDLTFHSSLSDFAEFIIPFKKPLFLFSHENSSMLPFIEKFKTTGLIFYAETLSGGKHLSTIKTEKKLLELMRDQFFDCIVRVGHTPLSKVWRILERNPIPVFHFDSRNLSGSSYGKVFPLSSGQLLTSPEWWKIVDKLLPYPVGDETPWLLTELIQKYPHSEVAFIKRIQDILPTDQIVYLGNSLVIRFFELTQNRAFTVFGNRGVNGIDGQLATAIGIAQGTLDNVFCILGDVTTFYDLSSLRDIPQNLHLIIINNQGGRIFDMLKLDKRIVLEHTHNFEKIILGMNLTYSNEFDQLGKVQVLELNPEQHQTELFLSEWQR